MTLTKAIEIKLAWRKDNYPPPLADEMNADMLSIEALRFVQTARRRGVRYATFPIPGETEE